MATADTSDFVYDFSCNPCEDEHISREASVFCVKCKQYLCDTCYKSHNRVAVAKTHRVLGKADFGKNGIQKALAALPIKQASIDNEAGCPTEACTRHGKLVEMYCMDHDVVVCNTCVSLEHRSCKDVRYIPDVAGTLLTGKSILATKQRLSSQIQKVMLLKKVRLDHTPRMTSEKDKSLNDVNTRRNAIKEFVDSHADGICKDIEIKYSETMVDIEEDVKTCEESIEQYDDMLKVLQNSENVNESQKFVDLKQTESFLKENSKKPIVLKGNKTGLLEIVFEAGDAIAKCVSPPTLFGRLKIGYHKIPQSVKQVELIDLNMKPDKMTCAIADMCQLPNGTIIVTDWNNEKIKSLRFDAVYTVSDFLTMPNPPWGLCAVDAHKLAVTVPGKNAVYFVSVNVKMTIMNSFDVDCGCHGIAYANKRLYVSHAFDSKLTTFDLQGKRLQTISTDKTGEAILGKPCHLFVRPEKQEIVVAAASKGVLVVDMHGKVLNQYKYPKKKFAYALCTDDWGNIYVADFRTHDLFGIGISNKITTFLTRLKNTPRALLYDKHTQKLFVSMEDTDEIHVYSIVY